MSDIKNIMDFSEMIGRTIKLDSPDLEFLKKFEKTLQAFIKLVEVIVEKEAEASK